MSWVLFFTLEWVQEKPTTRTTTNIDKKTSKARERLPSLAKSCGRGHPVETQWRNPLSDGPRAEAVPSVPASAGLLPTRTPHTRPVALLEDPNQGPKFCPWLWAVVAQSAQGQGIEPSLRPILHTQGSIDLSWGFYCN